MTINTVAAGEKDPFKFAAMLRDLAQGRSNAHGTVTLVANAATTTVQAPTCSSNSTVILTPLTAHASADFASGAFYVSTVGNGYFVVTHPNNANADKTFAWAAYG